MGQIQISAMKPYTLYRENGAWHFNTMSGVQIGPFWMKKDARADMDRWRVMEGLSYVQGGGWRHRPEVLQDPSTRTPLSLSFG